MLFIRNDMERTGLEDTADRKEGDISCGGQEKEMQVVM